MSVNVCVHGQGYVTCDDSQARGCRAATSVFPDVEIADRAARILGWVKDKNGKWTCAACLANALVLPLDRLEHLASD